MTPPTRPLPKKLFYDSIASQFDQLDNPHDIATRLSIVFDDLLKEVNLEGKRVLDVGCGYGAFSRRAAERGARVVSVDISHTLAALSALASGSQGVAADAEALSLQAGSFDYVISSEMIEHSLNPRGVLAEMARVLKPGGLLILTTPNYVWLWLVQLASRLKWRPFDGIENFLRWSEVEQIFREVNFRLDQHVGFHAWPFQIPLWQLSTWADRKFGRTSLARYMINQAILAQKPPG